MYRQLEECYIKNISEKVVEQLDSEAMLNYYTCYKNVLKISKQVNKRLYDEGLDIEKKLKHCLEIKSNFSNNNADFEEHHRECLKTYRDKYETLYREVFAKEIE